MLLSLLHANVFCSCVSSSNHLEACAALGALSKLVTVDMIPAVIGDVVKLLRHERELVRKKVYTLFIYLLISDHHLHDVHCSIALHSFRSKSA
jgi:vesicle coat complex subunit